jgi:hypothetical protein
MTHPPAAARLFLLAQIVLFLWSLDQSVYSHFYDVVTLSVILYVSRAMIATHVHCTWTNVCCGSRHSRQHRPVVTRSSAGTVTFLTSDSYGVYFRKFKRFFLFLAKKVNHSSEQNCRLHQTAMGRRHQKVRRVNSLSGTTRAYTVPTSLQTLALLSSVTPAAFPLALGTSPTDRCKDAE